MLIDLSRIFLISCTLWHLILGPICIWIISWRCFGRGSWVIGYINYHTHPLHHHCRHHNLMITQTLHPHIEHHTFLSCYWNSTLFYTHNYDPEHTWNLLYYYKRSITLYRLLYDCWYNHKLMSMLMLHASHHYISMSFILKVLDVVLMVGCIFNSLLVSCIRCNHQL